DHMPEDAGWYADQQAWADALGPFSEWELLDRKDKPDGPRIAKPDGCWIHLLPCRTHNHFVRSTGCLSANDRKAFVLHYKGVKNYMVQSINWYFFGEGEAPVKKRILRARERKERKKWASMGTKSKSSRVSPKGGAK